MWKGGWGKERYVHRHQGWVGYHFLERWCLQSGHWFWEAEGTIKLNSLDGIEVYDAAGIREVKMCSHGIWIVIWRMHSDHWDASAETEGGRDDFDFCLGGFQGTRGNECVGWEDREIRWGRRMDAERRGHRRPRSALAGCYAFWLHFHLARCFLLHLSLPISRAQISNSVPRASQHL